MPLPHVRSESTVHGKRWALPRRSLPAKLRLIPFALWLVLLGLCGFGIWKLFPLLTKPEREFHEWFDAVFWLAPLGMGVFATLWALRWTSLLILGHSEIAISRERVTLLEKSTPFWRRSRFSARNVRSINVVSSDGENAPDFLKNLGALKFETGSGKGSPHGALAYPREMLESVAIEARSMLLLGRPDSSSNPIPVSHETAELIGRKQDSRPDQEIIRQPPPENLRVLEVSKDGDLKLEVRGKGFYKGSHGLGCFATIWNVFIGAMLVLFIASALGPTTGDDGDSPTIMVFLFFLPFLAAGFFLFSYSLKLGTSTFTLTADAEQMKLDQIWQFGQKSTVLPQSAIVSIDVGPSGMTVNDQPVPELKITRVSEKPLGLLRQLEYEELQWIAAVLRLRLGVGRDGENDTETDQRLLTRKPGTCRVEPLGAGHRITAPPVGYFGSSGGVGIFALVWMVFVLGFFAALIFLAKLDFQEGWPFYGMLSLFFLIGLFSIYISLNRGTNRVVIETGRDLLKIDSRSIFQSRHWELPVSSIESIRSGPTGETVGNVKMHRLTIQPADGKRIVLLKQLSAEELRWLAAFLRRDLKIAS